MSASTHCGICRRYRYARDSKFSGPMCGRCCRRIDTATTTTTTTSQAGSASSEKIEGSAENWENGKLGRSLEHSQISKYTPQHVMDQIAKAID